MEYIFEILKLDDENFSEHKLPVLTGSCDFHSLKEAAAKSRYRCVIVIDEHGKFINVRYV